MHVYIFIGTISYNNHIKLNYIYLSFNTNCVFILFSVDNLSKSFIDIYQKDLTTVENDLAELV